MERHNHDPCIHLCENVAKKGGKGPGRRVAQTRITSAWAFSTTVENHLVTAMGVCCSYMCQSFH